MGNSPDDILCPSISCRGFRIDGSLTFNYGTSFVECIAGHYLEADTCVACPRGEWKVAG